MASYGSVGSSTAAAAQLHHQEDDQCPSHGHIAQLPDDDERQDYDPSSKGALTALGRRDMLRLISNCAMGFSNGITDSAPGAILPYMQSDYRITYGTVSLIFVANALGYLLAAPQSSILDKKLGRAGAYAASEIIMAIGFLMLVVHPPFPVTVAAYCFVGLGEAFNLALNNVFCASLGSGAAAALGQLHGSYGAGGTVGPLVATSMMVRGVSWSLFYLVGVACTIFNGITALVMFRGYGKPSDTECHSDDERAPLLRDSTPSTDSRPEPPVSLLSGRSSSTWDAFTHPTTILGAIFIFAYQGAEVSISGWMIEFLISYRGGDPAAVGYVTVGFWAGISLGRFFISGFAHRAGLKTSVALFTAACLGLQVLIWLTPSIIVNAVATALIGLLLGPVYPCAIVAFGQTLPEDMHLTSLSTISAMGSSGGAAVPLLAGLLAETFGTVVLHPLCAVMYSIMLLSWFSLPAIQVKSHGRK